MLNYRPEIDGLRAVAVLPVILFHAGFAVFEGGFVGVDIFFVISGYLITSLILVEHEKRTFSIRRFYWRRARRILPLLFVVMAACVPVAAATMLPSDLMEFSESLVGVLLFVSNFFYYSRSGYFDTAGEFLPLVHTWSLAVEEQFYLLYPLLLPMCLRMRRRWCVMVLAAVALSSLAAARFVGAIDPDAAFYLLPARIWELLAGAGAAVVLTSPEAMVRARPVRAQVGSLVGFGLILLAISTFDASTPSPSHYTVVPVAGAVLVIVFGRPETAIGRLLGSRAFVGTGLVSYGAYLWHQPLFAFARHQFPGELGDLSLLLLSASSVVLACITWRYVEIPFRYGRFATRPRASMLLACAFALCVTAMSVTGVVTHGYEDAYYRHRLTDRERELFDLVREDRDASHLTDRMADNGDCVFWTAELDGIFRDRFSACARRFGPATVVLGDSHAMSIFNALHKSAFDDFLVGVAQGGCRPAENSPDCPYKEFVEFTEWSGGQVQTVIFHQAGSPVFQNYARGRYALNVADVGRIADYLNEVDRWARVVWLGPYVEIRDDFRDIERTLKAGVRIRPSEIELFAVLDDELRRTHAAGSGTFEFVGFSELVVFKSDSLLIDGCLVYQDAGHFSACGEEVVGRELGPALRLRLVASGS